MDTLILCYHNILPDDTPAELLEAQLGVPRSRFLRHLVHLLRGRTAVSLDEVEGGRRPGPSLILTFDDGYRAVWTEAFPLLQRYGIPAYVLVNPAFVGGWNARDKLLGLALYGSAAAVASVAGFLGAPLYGGSVTSRARRWVELRGALWQAFARQGPAAIACIDALFDQHADDRVAAGLQHSHLMSWDDLAALRGEGIRVASHGMRHLELDRLAPDAVRREIRDARDLLHSRLGAAEPVFSYPRGKAGAIAEAEVQAAGYRWGLTMTPGRLRGRGPTLAAPRVLISPFDEVPQLLWRTSRLRAWASRRGRAVRFLRAAAAQRTGRIGRSDATPHEQAAT